VTVTRVLLVGDYPPPYGGVSVQIASLHRRLSNAPRYASRVLDIGAARRIQRPGVLPSRTGLEFAARLLLAGAQGDLIHLHTNGHNLMSWVVTLACAGAGLLNGRQTVVSIGSGAAPEFVGAARGPARVLITTALGLAGAVICRNERMRQALAHAGCRPEKMTILPGFYGIVAGALPNLPPEITGFMERHSPLAAAMASSSGPEYGLPLLLDAVTQLRRGFPRLGLVLIGNGTVEPSDGEVLATGELPHDLALSVIRKANVFVRPTYFDGDASSVREALALGVPVVASDTDFRPEGVVLFRRGEVDDLVNTLTRTLQRPHGLPHGGGADGDAFDRLLAIYDRLAPVGREAV